MTVRELIEMLQKFPPETRVIHAYHSDYEDLPEPKLYKKEDKVIALYNNSPNFVRWYKDYEKSEGLVEFIDVVHF